MDLNLENLKLGVRVNKENQSENVKNINSSCEKYFSSTMDNSLIVTNYTANVNSLYLNDNNEFKYMILNNYYGAISTIYSNSTTCEVSTITNRYFEEADVARYNRMDSIYKEHFKTGDILLYMNSNDTVTKEDGLYAYIYIDGTFYGVNKLVDGTSKNEYSTTLLSKRGNNNLQTLFGKDYWTILRPTLSLDIPENTSSESTNNTLDVPDTSKYLNMFMIIFGIIILTSGSYLIIKKRKNSSIDI